MKLKHVFTETVTIEKFADGRGKEYRRVTAESEGNASVTWEANWYGKWKNVQDMYMVSKAMQLEAAIEKN